ncbi:hypothetical protein IQ272_32765 [Chroococcidiopsidales cyanobacterium LEGE 13417]|nr:hypothetical protein [Chroococcidiopsidales cyanobacterium LEGE 13417]
MRVENVHNLWTLMQVKDRQRYTISGTAVSWLEPVTQSDRHARSCFRSSSINNQRCDEARIEHPHAQFLLLIHLYP